MRGMSAPGYHSETYVAPQADVGEHVIIGPFTAVLSGAKIGDLSRLGSHVLISDRVSLGERCEVGSGTILERGLQAGNDVIFGTGVTSTLRVIVMDGIKIGDRAMLTGGTKDAIIIAEDVESGSIITESCGVIKSKS